MGAALAAASEVVLQDWLRAARQLGLQPLSRLCDTLDAAHRILSYYLCPISTGPMEGLHAKFRGLNYRAYGHRDLEFLALRILFLHDPRFNLSCA